MEIAKKYLLNVIARWDDWKPPQPPPDITDTIRGLRLLLAISKHPELSRLVYILAPSGFKSTGLPYGPKWDAHSIETLKNLTTHCFLTINKWHDRCFNDQRNEELRFHAERRLKMRCFWCNYDGKMILFCTPYFEDDPDYHRNRFFLIEKDHELFNDNEDNKETYPENIEILKKLFKTFCLSIHKNPPSNPTFYHESHYISFFTEIKKHEKKYT